MTIEELNNKIIESEIGTLKKLSKLLDTIEIMTERIDLLDTEVKLLKEREETWRKI